MSNDVAQFSIRYSLLERPGIACAVCHGVLDRLPVLAVFRNESDGLPARPVCAACSKKLVPMLHLMLLNSGMMPAAPGAQKRPAVTERDDWQPLAEFAMKISTVEVSDVVGPFDEVVTRKDDDDDEDDED